MVAATGPRIAESHFDAFFLREVSWFPSGVSTQFESFVVLRMELIGFFAYSMSHTASKYVSGLASASATAFARSLSVSS